MKKGILRGLKGKCLCGLFATLLIICLFPVRGHADSVTVPDAEYEVSSGTITGIKASWLNSLMADSDGLCRISIEIPASISGTTITAIGANAFQASAYSGYPNLRITSINLSGATSLATIGSYAFYNNSGSLYSELSVDNFTLPNSITSLGSYAFAGQSGLKGELKMPDAMTTIGNVSNVFQGCTGFTSLDLNNVTSIGPGQRVFQDCTGLTSLDLKNVTTISGQYVFFRCTGVKTINLSNVQYLNGYNIFSSCTGLEGTLVIPASLRSWGDLTSSGSQFSGCGTASTGFTIQFPASGMLITTIPYGTFNGAKVIGDLVIPEGIVDIGNNAFSNLNDFSVPITSVTFPSTIRTIGNSAFNSCTSLAAVNFPATLSAAGAKLTIGNNAFANFAATVLTIPEYISSLGTQCFQSSNLSTVYLRASASDLTLPASGNSPFYTLESSAVIIAEDETAYNAWNGGTYTFNNSATYFKNQLTYEMQVDFCDPDTDDPIASMTPLKKLFNKSLAYVKNETTKEWTTNTAYTLPAVPAEYTDAKGWSFAKTGSAITSTFPVVVTLTKLYPTWAGVEYIWFGEYQQTLIKGPIPVDEPPDGVEGVDYVTLYVQGASSAADSYRYYEIEPIRWRILDYDDTTETYTLISESILDGRPFSTVGSGDGARWGASDIRAWLNGTGAYDGDGFYNQAFSTGEAALIDTVTLSDVSTTDKVYLLDYATADDGAYFPSAADLMPDYQDGTYGDAKMKIITFGTSYYKHWWLRTMLSDLGPQYAAYTYPLTLNPTATSVGYADARTNIGVRPMVTITLTDSYNISGGKGTYADPFVLGPKSQSISADVQLEAEKTLTGATLQNGQFSFTAVLDAAQSTSANATASATGTNDGNGDVFFSTLTITEAGTYVYKITENSGSNANISHDTSVYYAKIVVAADGSVTSVTYYKDDTAGNPITGVPVFASTYTGAPVIPSIPGGLGGSGTTTHTVTFNDGMGGTSTVRVPSGTRIPQPANPVNADSTFGGWYKDAALTQPWDFDTDRVYGDVTLYAKWIPKEIVVDAPKTGDSPLAWIGAVLVLYALCMVVKRKRTMDN